MATMPGKLGWALQSLVLPPPKHSLILLLTLRAWANWSVQKRRDRCPSRQTSLKLGRTASLVVGCCPCTLRGPAHTLLVGISYLLLTWGRRKDLGRVWTPYSAYLGCGPGDVWLYCGWGWGWAGLGDLGRGLVWVISCHIGSKLLTLPI